MNTSPVQSFPIAVNLKASRLVRQNGDGQLIYTGAGEAPLGSTCIDYLVDGKTAGDVHLRNAGGQHYVTAANDTPIAPNDPLTTAADGKVVKAAAGAEFFYRATEPGGGADSIFRAVPDHGTVAAQPAQPEAGA